MVERGEFVRTEHAVVRAERMAPNHQHARLSGLQRIVARLRIAQRLPQPGAVVADRPGRKSGGHGEAKLLPIRVSQPSGCQPGRAQLGPVGRGEGLLHLPLQPGQLGHFAVLRKQHVQLCRELRPKSIERPAAGRMGQHIVRSCGAEHLFTDPALGPFKAGFERS